jgi:hypothetical protein
MRFVMAFVLGGLAVSIVLVALWAGVATLVASGARDSVHLTLGPAVIIAASNTGGVSQTSLGPGVAAVAAAGGILNASLLGLLTLRGRRRNPMS